MSCLRHIKVSLKTKVDQSPECGPKHLQKTNNKTKTDNKRVSCKVCLNIYIEKIQKYFEKCENFTNEYIKETNREIEQRTRVLMLYPPLVW